MNDIFTANIIEEIFTAQIEGAVIQINNGGGLGVFNEIPTGSLNGVNTVFSTEFNYLTNSLSVYLNGIRQVRTAGHYSESGTNNFTMSEPPLAGDILLIDYQKTT